MLRFSKHGCHRHRESFQCSRIPICKVDTVRWPKLVRGSLQIRKVIGEEKQAGVPSKEGSSEGASTDAGVIYARMAKLIMPYWSDPEVGGSARWKLAGVVGLTLATTGVSVLFNFLGRDFFNALSEKNEELFGMQLMKYLGAFVVGIPVFVFKSYYQNKLALEWRSWLTQRLLNSYFAERTFYSLQTQSAVDNPDQRISSDAANFTGTAVNLSLTLLNAAIDLISFSGILYSIYPPLFGALIAYSVTGTAISITLGKPLVGLNFKQEAREADLRYGLVRVRENAEAVAFYRGENDEKSLLSERLKAAVSNYLGLLVASRNLEFFTSFYRYLIQLLPAAVVAPLFFKGSIEFGVINQSQSAFNHVLNDLSLVVYQFESLAGFSAVVDRLGQFEEAMDGAKRERQATGLDEPLPASQQLPAPQTLPCSTSLSSQAEAQKECAQGSSSSSSSSEIEVQQMSVAGSDQGPGAELRSSENIKVTYRLPPTTDKDMLSTVPAQGGSSGNGGTGGDSWGLIEFHALSVLTPDRSNTLVRDLELKLTPGHSLLVMGQSGAGKTSILRAVAGLWCAGQGEVIIHAGEQDVMFLPQKPYMVLGSLRDQVLYPRFPVDAEAATQAMLLAESGPEVNEDASSSLPGWMGAQHHSQNEMQPASTPIQSSPSSQPATPPPASSTSTIGSTSTSNGAIGIFAAPPSDSEVMKVLRKVRLGHLLSRYGSLSDDGTTSTALGAVKDWSSSLSLGEQQRLAWARLLLARPQLALLDEATSALDQTTEADLYEELARSGITFVSVGHRDTLRKYHSLILQLTPAVSSSHSAEDDAAAVRVGAQPKGMVTWALEPLTL